MCVCVSERKRERGHSIMDRICVYFDSSPLFSDFSLLFDVRFPVINSFHGNQRWKFQGYCMPLSVCKQIWMVHVLLPPFQMPHQCRVIPYRIVTAQFLIDPQEMGLSSFPLKDYYLCKKPQDTLCFHSNILQASLLYQLGCASLSAALWSLIQA